MKLKLNEAEAKLIYLVIQRPPLESIMRSGGGVDINEQLLYDVYRRLGDKIYNKYVDKK